MRSLTLALLLGVPAVGLFCLQWAVDTLFPGMGPRLGVNQTSLALKEGVQPQPNLQGRDSASPYARQAPYGENPFFAESNQGKILARGDPFYEALSSGTPEGVLVLKSTSRGVSTYGLPKSASQSGPISDRAILREIRIGVGGSYSKFLDSVFGTSSNKGTDPREQNPFAKPSDSAAANQPAGKEAASPAKPDAGSVNEAKPTSEPTPVEKTGAAPGSDSKNTSAPTPAPAPDPKPPDPAPADPVALFGPISSVDPGSGYGKGLIRPYLMLHVGTDGNLQAVRATQVDAQTFNSIEWGTQQFNVLPFQKPAETATAIAVADFNGDGTPDVCFLDAYAGVLHILFGNADGTYAKAMDIEVGNGPRSLAAGDFNRDGHTDIAVSNVGVGALTLLYLGGPGDPPSFKSFWLDTYRDYIAAADATGTGVVDLLGMNFANLGEVLDIGRSGGAVPGLKFTYTSALNSTVPIFIGIPFQLNAVLLKSNLSVNLQNVEYQMVNIVNVQAGNDVFVIAGDFNYSNTISVLLATLRK